ncbi:hypothetical protein CCP3SC1AL1_240034 [Gammaproteobacteria bacterium]
MSKKIFIFIKFFIIDIPLFIVVYSFAMTAITIINFYKTIKKSNHGCRFKSFWKRR